MDGARVVGTVLLGRYRVERVLASDHAGLTLKLADLQFGHALALTCLSREAASAPGAAPRFLRAVHAAARLRGEHAVQIVDAGTFRDGTPFALMEHIRGTDLASELVRRRMLPRGEAVDHVIQVCEALAEAHHQGLIHRDLKPSKLMLTSRADGTPLIKVLPCGFSKLPAGAGEGNDFVLGTPGYTSPEQLTARAAPDERADIWALGVILYECLNARRPFEAETFTGVVVRAATDAPPAMDARIPRGLRAAILRCLEKEPRRRFRSMAELVAALAPYAGAPSAAAIVAHRTRRMARARATAVVERVAPPQATARVRVGAGAPDGRAWSRHRYTIAATLLVAVAAVLSLVGSSPSPSRGAPPVVAPPRQPEASLTTDQRRQLAQCTRMRALADWSAFAACITALDRLGATERAAELAETLVAERSAEQRFYEFRRVLEQKDFRAAGHLIREIDGSSVYVTAALELLHVVQGAAFREAERRVHELADAHDCVALHRYLQQLAVMNPTYEANALRMIPCSTELPATARGTPSCAAMDVDDLVTQATTRYTIGYAKEALALVSRALTCKQELRLHRLAAMYACASGDRVKAEYYLAKIPASLQVGITQRCEQERLNPGY